ncbi:MAG: type II toxin-antitoxin system HicA family toxin [Candidatus Hydrogenedentota bacterium]
MARLPSLRSRELIGALRRAGFSKVRQDGSHVVLAHPDGREVIVPDHSRDLKRGTVFGILRQAGISQDELRKLL